MRVTIVDCYTDEPAGLGVPPTVGTYPRYVFGAFDAVGADVRYLTIDDLRAAVRPPSPLEEQVKTVIAVRNCTPNAGAVRQILTSSDLAVVIAGVNTPGTYLSAKPATTIEAARLLAELSPRVPTILTGPAASVGSGQWGGKRARDKREDERLFDFVVPGVEAVAGDIAGRSWDGSAPGPYGYDTLLPMALRGAGIVSQLPHRPQLLIAEIETMQGCAKDVPCSFCTEHIKHERVTTRPARDIVAEVRALSFAGLRNIRLGKQSCIYSYGSAEALSDLFGALRPHCDVLHIDNVNPLFVTREKTKALVAGCTEGNVASMGVESFDPEVIRRNALGNDLGVILGAITLINEYGARRGPNGMPHFLPGINLLFGLDGESKRTHEHNMASLSDIIGRGLMLRRINIREVVVFSGTPLAEGAGMKYLRKNRKFYWKWRNDVRQNIDASMLRCIVPEGTVLRGLRTEVYDGNTTFARQIGSYSLVVGIKGRIGLDRMVDARIGGHMLRSVTGSVC